VNGLRAVVVCLVIACAAVVSPAWSTGRADGPEGTFAPRLLRFG
jgi:hypothetical protein